MKLYAAPTSPYVRKVLVQAHELGLIERITQIVTNPHTDEGLRAHNPLCRIPTLESDAETGLPVLFDSLVICDWLDRQAPAERRLIPAADPARTEGLRRHALGQGMMDEAVYLRMRGMEDGMDTATPGTGAAPIQRRWQAIIAALDLAERETGAMTAAPLDLGHISLACALGYLDFRFAAADWRPGRPQLAAWFDDDIALRPSMQATRPPAA